MAVKSNSQRVIELRKKRKDNAEEKPSSVSKSLKNSDRARLLNYNRTIGIDTLSSDITSLSKTLNSVYSGWQTKETMSNTLSSVQSMYDRIGQYQDYVKQYGGTDLSDLQSTLKSTIDEWETVSKQYGKYKNAKEYSSAVKASKKLAEEYEGMKTADLTTVQKEITSLNDAVKKAKEYKGKVDNLKGLKQTAESRSTALKNKGFMDAEIGTAEAELNTFLKSVGYNSYDELEKALGEKKQYKNKAEWIQKGIELSSVGDEKSANYDKDFAKKSQYIAPKEKTGFRLEFGVQDDELYKYINDESYRNDKAQFVNGNADASLLTVGYEYMTDKEKQTYNYYYNSGDIEKANEYLNTITEELGNRKSVNDFDKIENKTGSELAYGVIAGFDQFASGLKNVFNFSDEYIPVNATQQMSAMVRDDLAYNHGSLGQVGYDLINTTSNMLPSILTSTVIGSISKTAGAYVGSALMGTSAAGNAYQEMLNLGYDKGQARVYSSLVGASEATLQKVMGGIGSLGGVSGKLSKLVSGIDNGLARFAIQWGGSALSEGLEEATQEVLNPIFQNIVAGYDVADVDWGEVVYSGLLGALSGGLLEGGPLAVNSIAEHSQNKALGQNIKANERVGDLFDIASNPEVATAYEAFSRFANKGVTAENISDVQLGRLYGKVKADNVDILNSKESTEEQKTDALKRLTELSNVKTENIARKEAKQEFNVGEETKVTESGVSLDVKDLNVKVKGDEVTVATKNGEISVDDVTLTQNDAELIVRAKGIAKTDGEDVANLFISQYDGKTNPEAYAISFNQTMAYAKNNYTHDEILNKKGNLSAEQVSAIYAETRIKADKERAEYIKKLNKKMADKGFYKGFIDESVIDYENTSAEGKVNWNDLTARQRNAVTFIKGFAQATGMNLEFVANNSKYNGKYDRATNTFTINLDKGGFDAINNLQETIIPTMSHETTHWMKEKSPELWRNLNEIVFSTLTEHYNSNTEQAIKDKIALLDRLEPRVKHTEEDAKGRVITEEDLIRAEMNRKGKSEDVSREEIIARACEDMLKMSEQGRKIFFSLSEAEQKTLVGKIKSLINNLLNWVNELLNSYEATSTEARIMRDYKEQLQKASKVWDEMLKKSVEANQSLEKSGAYEHKKSTSEGDVLEQAKELDSNGNSYWQIETEKDIFAGIDTVNELQKAAYNFILNGDKGNKIFGTIDGAKIEFIRVSAREYVYGEASKTLTTEEYKQKMRMSTSIIDLIENASIEYDSPDHKNHKLFPNGFKNYQGRVGIDETIFRYIVRVGKSKDGMIFYDINLEVDGKVPRAKRTSLIKSSTSNDSILNSDKIVKEKNSDKTIDGYAKANEMQKEINQFTEQIRQMESSDDFEAIMGVIKNDTEKGLAEYNKWLKESGYSEIREKRDALQNELNQLRKDLQESSKQKALDEEQKAIEKSGLSEADYFRKQAVKEFGYTPYFYDAGYITPNGKMLNFSGEKGMHYGSRGQDHRAICIVYANVEGSKAMVKFMGEGNIRIMAESPGLDISSSVVPTTEQYATIRKFVREYANKEYFNIDLTDAEGHTIGNYEYEGKISAERVVNDIKYFFENGTTREQSSISQFLYSDKNTDIATQINTSMTMDEAKQMIQRAFVIGGIYEWYDREYKNGDDWLRGVGTSEVALNIENEYTLTEKYLNKLEGYIDGDFYVEDILEAYLNGTLVGKEKPKSKRLDISKEYRINDDRFYSPQRIKDAKKLLSVATQRMTEKNREEVSNARAKVLIFAHNKGASELLGMTQAELNKKLRAWSNYSAKARDISKRFNNGVADSNKWTGIENCSWLYKGTVTTKDLESLVKSVKGASSDYEKFYIARTMLALDTHIDWSWLSFEFDTYNEVNKGKTFSVSKCLGYYTNESRKIVVTHDKPHTVAHEMGHALDYQWARDLGFNYEALTEVSRHTERITDAETKQFFENFRIFIDSLTDNGDIRSEYTQNPKEVFARFVARFVQWVDNTGTGRNSYNIEASYYNDKFTASNYIEFVKLLQEKAMLDAKKMESNSLEEVRFSEKDNEYLELAKDPIKNEARLREMVYEAAKKAGYTDDSSWRMEHSAPNSRDDVSLDNLKESGLVPDDFWEHPEWYTYSAEERESYYKVKKALERQEKLTSEGKTRDAYMWVYRAVDKTKNTKEDYFRNGDWVTPSYDYAVNEGKMNPNGYRIIKHSVSIKHLYWDGNSIAELGYDDGNNYAYADTLNNRKLLDAVTYDDDGNVIPLSKRFKRRNWDVRFSEKEQGIYDVMGETERIRKENEKFKAEIDRLNERLKIERKVTHGNYFNENQLGAVAGHLRNISKSNMDKVKLMKALKDLYSFIAHSSQLTWDEVHGKSYSIAEAMLAEAKPEVIVDDYSKYILSDIRKTRISLDETQKKEAQYHFGKNWNRYFMGKVIIANDGINIDAKWQEWASMYPELFDADTNSGNMISELYNIIGSLQDASATIDEYATEEKKRWLANEIYNQYWNVSPIRTTADKYDKQIKRLNFEHRRAMSELRDDYNTRLKEQHKADKEKQKKLIAEIRERKDAEIALAKEHGREMMSKYKENAERKTRIQSITSNALSLNEMLVKNSKDKHIPEILKEPVTALLQAIDFSSKRLIDKGEPTQKDVSLSKALSKVKDMMVKASNAHEELVELYGHGLDEKIEKMVDDVDDIMRTVGDNEFILNKMSATDLQTLDMMVKTIRVAVNKLNKFHTVNHAKGIASLSKESVTYLNTLGKAKIYDGKRGAIKKMLDWGNALPYYAFKRFGSGGTKVYEALQDGWDKFAFNVKTILDYANETYTSEEVNEWSKEIKNFKVPIPASEADLVNPDYEPEFQEVQLTVPQIMSMYCLNKREQARGHLFQGGIRVADFKDAKGKIVSQAEGIIFTEDVVSSILNSLSDRQINVADALQRFMNTVSTDWGNEVSMARFGYKAFGEENYFPIQSDKNNLAVNDETEQVNSLFKLLNMSFTKSIEEKANNRIVISDIFDVFAQHTSDMAKYNALALPVLDAFKWYNFTEKQDVAEGTFKTSGVKQAMEEAFGGEFITDGGKVKKIIYAQEYFTTFLKDINGQQEVSRDTLGKGFFSNAKIAAVGANLRVVALQPTSYVRASAIIDNKYLMKAFGHKPKIDKAETYCGIALWKSMGYYDTNIQRGVEAQIKHADTLKDKLVEKSMWGAEIADKITWGYLWNACELEIRETRSDLKVGSEEFYEVIGKRLRDVIYATQVVDSTMTRSQMMRSGDRMDKALTAFASEPTLSYNMLQDAYMQLSLDARAMGKKEAWQKNGKRIGRIVVAYTVTNAVAALVESAFDAFRKDDDEEKDMLAFMKLYFKNFALDMSVGNKIPYIKELYSFIQGFSSSRTDTQWMEELTKAGRAWYKIFTGEGKASSVTKYTIKAFSTFTGLPIYNVYRELMALLNNLDLFTAEDLNEMFGDFSD